MIDVIRTRSNEKVIDKMIEARSMSAWSMLRHDRPDMDFKAPMVSYDEEFNMFSIRTEVFLNRLLTIDDDFAIEVNEIIYDLEEDDSTRVIQILKGKYGDDINEDGHLCGSGYTYNEETHLDREIAYEIFEYNDAPYIFIEVHYGVDARAGFGAMVCFKLECIDLFFLGTKVEAYDYETEEELDIFDIKSYAFYYEGEWFNRKTGEDVYISSPAENC